MSVVVNEFEVVPEPAATPEPGLAHPGADPAEVERQIAEHLRLRALRVERLRAG